MFSNNIPKFSDGLILKGKMLENIGRYPEDFIESQFRNYSKGIISGANISVDNDFILISPGILKNGNKVYIKDKATKIKYINSGRETIIKLRFIDNTIGSDFTSSCGEAFLDDDLEMKKDEFELGRFNIKTGSLNASYKSFRDLKKENSINLINVPYSHIGEYTLNPLILSLFGSELLKKEVRKSEDNLFLMKCLQEKSLGRDVIVNYLKLKRKEIKTQDSNEKIYKTLLEVLKI